MLISTDKGTAQIVSARDETRFYDDLGCFAADWPNASDVRAYVRVGNDWIDAQTASYAQPAGLGTPMGSGFAAFAYATEARAADREGRALTFDDLRRAAGTHP